jgi:uncharacterized protein YwqG
MQREQAIELIRSSALSNHSEALISHLAPSARIILDEDSENTSEGFSTSYFGGQPLLPENMAWPDWDKTSYLMAEIDTLEKTLEKFIQRTKDQPEKIPGSRERRLKGFQDSIAKNREELSIGRIPLAFLGQVSLRDLASVAPLPGWPNEGILAFFYDHSQLWGFDPLDRGHCRVLFYPEDVPLIPAEFPQTLPADARYPQRSLKFRCEWTLPTYLELKNGDLAIWKMDEYRDLLEKVNSDKLHGKEIVHRVGGYPQEVQGDMRLKCRLVTNGLYCGDRTGYNDPRSVELEKGASDWQLLAQFDSDEARLGWMWGDVGRVYFWARRQDIESANFGNCWAVLQCG